jgi:hypothetical protein
LQGDGLEFKRHSKIRMPALVLLNTYTAFTVHLDKRFNVSIGRNLVRGTQKGSSNQRAVGA